MSPDTIKRVSVIVRTCNRKDYLMQALDCLKKQTFRDFEIIVVDDGSEDGTREIIERYGISKMIRLNREGRVASLNAGLARAESRLVAFLDDDDLWHKDRLKRGVELLDREKADLVWTDYRYFRDDLKDKMYKLRRFNRIIMPQLLMGNFIPTSTVMLKKEWINMAGGFDECLKTNEDWDMWLRLAYAGARFALIDETLSYMRLHEGAKSNDKVEMLRGAIQVLRKFKANDKKGGYHRIINGSIVMYKIRLGVFLTLSGLSNEGRKELKAAVKYGSILALVCYLIIGFIPVKILEIMITNYRNMLYRIRGVFQCYQ